MLHVVLVNLSYESEDTKSPKNVSPIAPFLRICLKKLILKKRGKTQEESCFMAVKCVMVKSWKLKHQMSNNREIGVCNVMKHDIVS